MTVTPTNAIRLLPALVLLLAGCASGEDGPGEVRVQAGAQDVQAQAVQGCEGGDPVRYDTQPPVVEVPPDTEITLTVPASVAERGWAVQFYDENLEEAINEPLDVPDGEAKVSVVSSADAVPPAFYLLVIENKGGDCGAWSRAWPVGFIRAG
ncbi:DUF2771 family protein [Candidatus Blastococcus massiliensis]|uniref:DUF2771 family protein n=1 Tax=Candidatus Blastococcus massiliensis TaxID=1470358 RepID=UPI0004B2644E|nr:DUF2771 family protein [Candidatus Blastococcus massiliensis]